MSVNYNPEETEYTTDPDLIYERYQHLVDLVIDGGTGEIEPSTVIDCISADYVVRRQGKGILVT
jgi:tRNA A37 threonylcarbamoyladenosine synthetase subunit TsaC/SUA5/YrdC